ncbi:AhpD family alkylhydroperoxidase [Deinobacterium chartae]|uniref:AhpD family alkylhydroperoxidase n=1 Tax=Deinobacterium chartae TaxID=521158 RepID=A0A841I242_9DEIO|nr:AhpD family alkylhydroperoxidase [Deinobacterium chartae]
MTQRINYRSADPAAYQAVLGLERYLAQSGLDSRVLELIRLRASQINGCAFCIDLHARDARRAGESEERIYLLSAWREAPHFSEAERAVLALTEQVTLIGQGGVSDEVYQQVRCHYDEAQVVALILAISTINVWNRIAIATRMAPPLAPKT